MADKEVVKAKLEDVELGAEVEFDPDEAEYLGAFEDDSLSEEDALESRFDDE